MPGLSENMCLSASHTFPPQTKPTPGLDRLGCIARDVAWDPQLLSGSSARGYNCHEQQHIQEAWAYQIFDSLGLTEPGAFHKSIRTETAAHVASSLKMEDQAADFAHSSYLDTLRLTKRTAVFFEELYEPLCAGIFPRAYVYPRLGRKAHAQDPGFAALVLSMSTLGMLRLRSKSASAPTMPHKRVKSASVPDGRVSTQLAQPFVMPAFSSSSLKSEMISDALAMITEALNLRALSEGTGLLGEKPTLEGIMTSFFISIVLYALHLTPQAGDDWTQASLFRFSEAVTLAKLLKLDSLGLQALDRDTIRSDDACTRKGDQEGLERCVRVWLLLVRAEQWWARRRPDYQPQLQQRPFSSRAAVPNARKRPASPEAAPDSKRSHCVRDDGGALLIFQRLGYFDVFRDLTKQHGHLTACLEGYCHHATCTKLTSASATHLHDSLAAISCSSTVSPPDFVLLDLARQVLRCRLWRACDSHGLVSAQHEGPIRSDLLLHVALDVLDLLVDLEEIRRYGRPSVATTVQTAVGEIRSGLHYLTTSRYLADVFIIEEEDSVHDSTRETSLEAPIVTTILQGSRAILLDLDHFLHQLRE